MAFHPTLTYHRHNRKALLPVPRWTWQAPSRAQQKDAAGNADQVRFRLRARLHDGFVAWQGWFDDRDDADAFLYAIATGQLRHEPALWRLPIPMWEPDLDGNVTFEFATVTFLTTTGAGTYSLPADWNSSNSIELIAAGGRSLTSANGGYATGGAGGGAYSKKNNVTLGATTDYSVGAGSSTSGTVGGDSFFGAAVYASSLCAAKGGGVGASLNSPGSGGAAASGIGDTRYSGGDGGSGAIPVSWNGGGGGGGAGPNGNGGKGGNGLNDFNGGSGGGGGNGGGGNGANGSSTQGGNGGVNNAAAGAGAGATTNPGAGGAGSNGGGGGGARSSADGGNGSNGQEWDSGHGSGGAGGGCYYLSQTGGASGLYGAGTPCSTNSVTSAQGIIVVTYSPLAQFMSFHQQQAFRYGKRMVGY